MSYENSWLALSNLVQSNPVFNQALVHLEKGREIRILLEGQHECALLFRDGAAQVENRKAQSPDIEFHVYPEALRVLAGQSTSSMAEFGTMVVKQILAGTVKVYTVSGLISVLRGGYLQIVTAAGPEFMGVLAQHGLKSLGKIQELVSALKKP